MTMPDTLKQDELVARLRSRKGEAITRTERLMDEAADRLEALQADLERVTSERDEALRIAKGLTRAIVGLTPGGSEYFTRGKSLPEEYFADADACTRVVRERFERGHQARLDRGEQTRRATTAEAALVKARTALEPFAEAADNLDDNHADGSPIWESPAAMGIDARDLRAAREALKTGEDNGR